LVSASEFAARCEGQMISQWAWSNVRPFQYIQKSSALPTLF
jgi:hypothetical protein